MVLFVSGRTDIIAFYSKWFIKRLEAGFIDSRNPYNRKLVSRIYFDDVDAIMFCTKNPLPILDYLPQIKIPMLFHVTLTPYKNDIEPNVPNKKEIINSIKQISSIVGSNHTILRYDPIFINETYTLDYHIKAFKKITMELEGCIERIIISFVDDYKNVRRNKDILKIKPFTDEDFRTIGIEFSDIAKKHNIVVQTCAEHEDLVQYGFVKGDCFSKELAFKLTGKHFKEWKSRGSEYCHCVEMVDIGDYNTCSHFCKYCYANYDEPKVYSNDLMHDDESSLLIGRLKADDIIRVRKK